MTITYTVQVPCIIDKKTNTIKCSRLNIIVKATPILRQVVEEKAKLNCIGCPIFALNQYARMLLYRTMTKGKARIEIREGEEWIYLEITEEEEERYRSSGR